MTVAGIDYNSFAVDIVLVDEDAPCTCTLACIPQGLAPGQTCRNGMPLPAWHHFPIVAGGDAFDRTRRVRASLPGPSWWEDHDVIAIGIEDPRGHRVGALYRVQGAILQCLDADLLVQPWPPSVWRKAVGLSGNASKGDVAAHARTILGTPLDWPQDAYDALCIAYATRDALDKQT